MNNNNLNATHAHAEIIYLSFAETTIKIVLHETEWEKVRTDFLKAIKDCYSGCFVADQETWDWEVELFDTRRVEIVKTKKSASYFVFLYAEKKKQHIITSYHLSIFQFQALMGDLVKKTVIKKGGLFIHASSVTVKNYAYIFIGTSEQGKSTILHNLMKYGAQGLCDDSVILLKKNDGYQVFQTPFPEKLWNVAKKKQGYKLKSAFFLKKSSSSLIKKLNNSDIVSRLVSECWWEKTGHKTNFQRITEFVNNFGLMRELSFNKNAKKELLELIIKD